MGARRKGAGPGALECVDVGLGFSVQRGGERGAEWAVLEQAAGGEGVVHGAEAALDLAKFRQQWGGFPGFYQDFEGVTQALGGDAEGVKGGGIRGCGRFPAPVEKGFEDGLQIGGVEAGVLDGRVEMLAEVAGKVFGG